MMGKVISGKEKHRMKTSKYELELQRIFSGNKAQILNVTKTCNKEEKESYLKVMNKPFFVQRSPGSLGVDLLSARGDITFLVEVKSSIHNTINLGTYQLRKQYEVLKECSEKYRITTLYAFRKKNIKGDSWRMFTVPCDKLEGRQRVINIRLPKVDMTRNGVPVLKFENGLPLHFFILYLCR